jgi:hypothetical protein
MKFTAAGAAGVCGVLSIVAASAAAGLWAWSALVDISVPTDAVLLDASNPLIVALHHAANLNAGAAGLTGASVLLAVVERVIRWRVSEAKYPGA